MKRPIAVAFLVIALVTGIVGFASTASAHPTKKSACSGCHGSSSAVKISLKKKSSTSTKATYTIKITGGSGSVGWAVLGGGKNLAHGRAKSGTFSIAKGKTVKVWAVRTDSGAASKKLSVK